jgi:hypothetical protein
MSTRLLILLLLFYLLESDSFAQNISNDDRLRNIVRQSGQAEVTIPYPETKGINNLTLNVSIMSVRDRVVYISLSPLTVEWFILQKFDYSILEKTDSKGIISAHNVKQAMQWDKYPTYSQYDSIMQSFQNLFPALCHLDTIGTSINGKLVLALKISDNALFDEDEPEVFYSSSIHGDETGGFILLLRLADYLLKNYSLNKRVKNLADNLEIWINPLANPDGMYNTGNSIFSPTRFNANGVDLNRNFPDPLLPVVIPQKENRDMIKFMRSRKFVLSANFHSGAEVVNYPWDRWSRLHADDAWFYEVSREYADTVHANSVSGYMKDLNNGITNGYAWYQITGGRQDFVTYELHGREVTIELDRQYFVTPAANLNSLWQYNWQSLIGYLENTLYGIHGVVRNINTNAPVPAKVFITGHDIDNSHIYSDTLSGSFVRLLSPGSWNLTFSATGFLEKTVSNIAVVSGQKSELAVFMEPIINSVDTVDPETPFLYPNPARDIIKVVLPEKIIGTINIRIISQSGMIMSDYTSETIRGIPLQIDLKMLPGGSYTVLFKNTFNKILCTGRFIVIN